MVSGIVEKRQVHRRHANEVRQKQDNRKMITGKVMGAGWTMWTWKQVDVNRRTDGEGGYSNSMKALIKDCILNPKLWDKNSKICPP